MSEYNTNQKKEILELLMSKNELLSVKEIHNLINNSGKNVGITTIYRYLNHLEEENKIKKYIENNEAKYLLISESNLEEVYIKCEKCGTLTYFDCSEIKKVKQHLENHHNIIWNFAKSSMVGKCVNCMK